MISVLIPARNEFLLSRTIKSILESAEGEIEIIAVLDGYWPEPIQDDPRVTLVHHTNPIGQRAAVNEAARIAKGKYILKTDAHSMFDKGFDVKLAADCEYDWTVIPRMYNLHAFDWVCKNGHRFYQDKFLPEGGECKDCGKPVKMEWVWKPRLHKKTDFMYMDKDLKVQYWYKYAKRKESKDDIVDIMNGVGACWFQYKDRFWELGGLDENHGSWGQVGVEVACKAWLSGGRHVVNRKTWFSHLFRTTKEFTFPYGIKSKQQDESRKYSRDLWLNDKWPLQKRPFKWMLEKFQPIPTWEPVKPEKKLLLSVIIPARNEMYLQRTIDDCLEKLTTNFEIIVGLDSYKPELKKDPRVVLCHSDKRIGMRPMINKMARMAKGKYLMKLDAHCIIDEGIDAKLIDSYTNGDTVVAVRYELDTKRWKRRERTDCPYRYLSHPDVDEKGGLRGLAWPSYAASHRDEKIGETMSIAGSIWLMEREQFIGWGGLDEKHGTWGQEGVEISCMTWLSGGKVLVNKNTWYAHWNRGKTCYGLSSKEKPKSIARSIDVWMGDKWPYAKRKFKWLINHFSPVPGWNKDLKPKEKMRPHGYKVRIYSVDELYDNFAKYAKPTKAMPDNPRGVYELQKTFRPFVKNVLAGDKYTDDELRQLPYYGYLIKHLNPRLRNPLTAKGEKHVLHLMRNGIRLCIDIRDNGMKFPLDIYKHKTGQLLIRGQRRVIILKHIGQKEAVTRVFNSKEEYERKKHALDIRHGGSIEELSTKQFAEKWLGGTDKYWFHNYTHLYDRYLTEIKKKPNILEIGVGKGASLKLWKDAFPRATVSGIDIENNVNDFTSFNKGQYPVRILNGESDKPSRDCLNLFIGDQSNSVFLEKIAKIFPKGFDLIIDDGSHNPRHQLASLQSLWPHLCEWGVYVIEDLRGQPRYRHRRYVIIDKLKAMIDEICLTEEVESVSIYRNICFIQKGKRQKRDCLWA